MRTEIHSAAIPSDINLSRRRFLLATAITSFTTYALLQEARATGTMTGRRLSSKRWIDRQEELTHALRTGSISDRAWHEEVRRVGAEVDIAELMAEIRRRSSAANQPFMRDPVKRNIRFVDSNGLPAKLSYAAATFSFGPQNVITPHAHKFMASAHMVVEGKVRIRTFDRVGEEIGALRIRPTADHIADVGTVAAMTTEIDNVHWFTPATPTATTFDVIVDGLSAGEDRYLIQPVDPLNGHVEADGSILAPLLTFEESMLRYDSKK
jgi:hypothetical protein